MYGTLPELCQAGAGQGTVGPQVPGPYSFHGEGLCRNIKGSPLIQPITKIGTATIYGVLLILIICDHRRMFNRLF